MYVVCQLYGMCLYLMVSAQASFSSLYSSKCLIRSLRNHFILNSPAELGLSECKNDSDLKWRKHVSVSVIKGLHCWRPHVWRCGKQLHRLQELSNGLLLVIAPSVQPCLQLTSLMAPNCYFKETNNIFVLLPSVRLSVRPSLNKDLVIT